MAKLCKTMQIVKFVTETGQIVETGAPILFCDNDLVLIESTPDVVIGEYTSGWREVGVE